MKYYAKWNSFAFFTKSDIKVKLAERSKAPDLSSGTRMCAWVRTPHLTNSFFEFLPQLHCPHYASGRELCDALQFPERTYLSSRVEKWANHDLYGLFSALQSSIKKLTMIKLETKIQLAKTDLILMNWDLHSVSCHRGRKNKIECLS